METIAIPRQEYQQMVTELETLRKTELYARLLQFMEHIKKKKFTRADLGF